MFDIEEIASISGLTADKVKTFLPGILKTIRDYTHRSFVTSVSISGNIIINNGVIQVSNVPTGMTVGSIIELRGSLDNTRLYSIVNVTNNTIETNETLNDEEFKGFVIKLSFNIDDSTIADFVTFKNTLSKRAGFKSESIDGYSYQLNIDSNNSYQGYPLNLLSSVDHLKQLPGSEKEEYYRFGYYDY